jgi:hypothetical protein
MSAYAERIKAVINGDCRTIWKLMFDIFTNVSYAQGQLAHIRLLEEHMRAEDTYEEFQQRFDDKANHLISTGYDFDEASIIQSHVSAISNNAGFTRDIDVNSLSTYTSYADLVVDLTQHAQEYRNSIRLRDMYKQERSSSHAAFWTLHRLPWPPRARTCCQGERQTTSIPHLPSAQSRTT